jgi:hypothetical protein
MSIESEAPRAQLLDVEIKTLAAATMSFAGAGKEFATQEFFRSS